MNRSQCALPAMVKPSKEESAADQRLFGSSEKDFTSMTARPSRLKSVLQAAARELAINSIRFFLPEQLKLIQASFNQELHFVNNVSFGLSSSYSEGFAQQTL